MPRIHSHYENLKVARDAPPEVIRAAYRALARRYHPDVNASDEAVRVMSLLNRAMDALGDPENRKAHDRWIAEAEASIEVRVAAVQLPPQDGSLRPTWPTTSVPALRPRPKPAAAPAAAPRARHVVTAPRSEQIAKVAVVMMIAAAAISGALVVNLP